MAAWTAAIQTPMPTNFDSFYNAFDLMQNCDLPPPVKPFFSASDKTHVSSIRGIYATKKGEETEHDDVHFYVYKDCSEIDRLEILKALRLSQTRAREAERKLRILAKENDKLLSMLIDESMKVFAHRRMVSMLEFQVYQQQDTSLRHDGNGFAAIAAFCLAIVGFGFAVGCSYPF